MPKIIGETDPRMVKHTSCGGCAAVLEYTRSEMQDRKHTDYTGCTDTWKVIVCPRCNGDIRV
jgi:Zn finger protein HypA/HybF involved in hydrogenase expression